MPLQYLLLISYFDWNIQNIKYIFDPNQNRYNNNDNNKGDQSQGAKYFEQYIINRY